MPSLTIKSIPDKMYRSLKRNAGEHHRSLNGEVLTCLERILGLAQTSSEDTLSRIDSLRTRVKTHRLTDKMLRTAKQAGRA